MQEMSSVYVLEIFNGSLREKTFSGRRKTISISLFYITCVCFISWIAVCIQLPSMNSYGGPDDHLTYKLPHPTKECDLQILNRNRNCQKVSLLFYSSRHCEVFDALSQSGFLVISTCIFEKRYFLLQRS